MNYFGKYSSLGFVLLSLGLFACAEVTVPDARNVNIPTPVGAEKRKDAVNERPDSVLYLPLGEDVLVPERIAGDSLPKDVVGPFELRGETLAGALQLILADYDISIAFESEEGLTRKVTVANLRGELGKVVNRVCSLADLYCSYEDETLVIKDSQTFAVTLPPLADAEGGQEFINDVIQGLGAVLGEGGSTPVSDPTTRTIIYSATQRTSQLAENYFQRLRANTAMIVYETYIWEVSLDAGNSTGIDWDSLEEFGKFGSSISINGSIAADFTNPISIGLPTTQAVGASPTDFVQFLSQFGAVKTISQPQITVLSGASAELRVADTQNFVSEVSSTISGDQTTTSVSTDSVDSGFTLTIGSSWDKSTVYSNVNVNLTNVVTIDDFTFSDGGAGGTDTIIQLPQTTERELTTQIRVRPGDSVLIGGLVRETDNFDSRGPGFMEPIIPDSRTLRTQNLELVILLRPRVIVYTANDDKRYTDFIDKKNISRGFLKADTSYLKETDALMAKEPTNLLPQSAAVSPAVPITQPTAKAFTASKTVTESTPVVVSEPVNAPLPPAPIVLSEPDILPTRPAPVIVQEPIVAPRPMVMSQPVVPRPIAMSEIYAAKRPINRVQNNSAYAPSYVSNSRFDLQSLTTSPPQYATPIVNASGEVIAGYSEQDYSVSPALAASTEPSPNNIYQNVSPLNVYEAYERSKNSYYAP